MHFSHCLLRLRQIQTNISSLNLEETFYRLTYSPTSLYLKFPRVIPTKPWTVALAFFLRWLPDYKQFSCSLIECNGHKPIQ